MTKISQLPQDTTPTVTDFVPTVDVETGVTKRTLLSAILTLILKAQNPVGSVYINATDATNPATLFGFGTWVAFGAGRVPVGKAATGTFVTAGGTGGEETHTQTVNEMPSHNHEKRGGSNGDFAGLAGGTQGGWGFASGTNNAIYRDFITSTGGGAAFNVLQPYVVVYMWQRTA